MRSGAWQDLDRALLAAHACEDRLALIELYAKASDMAATAGEIGRAAFFATHAWIFALEAGDARVDGLRRRLADWGRLDGEGA